MTPAIPRLISSSSTTTLTSTIFPPKPPISKQQLSSSSSSKDHHHHHQQQPIQSSFLHTKTSRRDASLLPFLALIPSLYQPAPATAFGISGPKDWLRDQKKKASRFLLAPIDASRNSLRTAYQLLTASDYSYSDKDLEEVQRLLSSAARDCVIQDRNSLVAFQASTGVEVCTFRLVVKNAASLLDNKDPVKLEAESMLNDLIRSFTSLNSMVNETDIQIASNRQKVAHILMDTISSLDKFEKGIRDCLEI